jgi:hypothetical protein
MKHNVLIFTGGTCQTKKHRILNRWLSKQNELSDLGNLELLKGVQSMRSMISWDLSGTGTCPGNQGEAYANPSKDP